jgi:23S rRNA (adenine2503-C2)-methyltransferase
MPVNRRYGVDAVLAACGRYFDRTGRRISYEYVMINGVNDTVRHAHLLAEKMKGTGSHVNLIPLNDVPESRLKPSTPEDMKRFIAILKQQGINVTVRRKLGPDIEASCGQLRRQTEKTGLV